MPITACVSAVDRLDAEHVGVGVGQRLPAAVEHARQALELFTGALVERALLDGAHVHVERQHRIEQALLGVLRDAVEHARRAAPDRASAASSASRTRISFSHSEVA